MPRNDDFSHNAIFHLLTTVGFVVVSGLTVADPPVAMRAYGLPLTHANNCSAEADHEPDELDFAALATPALPARTNAISRIVVALLACLQRNCRGETVRLNGMPGQITCSRYSGS